MTEEIIKYYSDREKEYEETQEKEKSQEEEENEVPKRTLNISAEAILDSGNDDELKVLTNFTITEFNEIYEIVGPILQYHSHSDAIMTPKTKLLLTICWCKHFEPWKLFANHCGVNFSYLSSIVKDTIEKTHIILKNNFIKWISVSDRMNQSIGQYDDWPTLLGSVDATVQQICRPKINQEAFYSGKHKMHCIKVQAFVSPTGFLMHYSHSVPGAVHDFKLFRQSELPQLIDAENQKCNQLFSTNAVTLADSGYQGIDKIVNGAISPYKKPRNSKLTIEKRLFNYKISKRRIMVENWFARLKNLWSVMGRRYNQNITTYECIWIFCASLTNFHIRNHALRSNVKAFNPNSDDDYDETS